MCQSLNCFLNPAGKKALSKFSFYYKETRDLALPGAEVAFFNTTSQLVEILFKKKFRLCHKCQRYGHIRNSCRSPNPSRGKCTGAHLTRDCNSQTRKFVNFSGAHQSGVRFGPTQIMAVVRYRCEWK